MNKADFEQYFQLFNARKYDEFIKYYADDLIYDMDPDNGKVFHGPKELTDMYKVFHQHFEEIVEVEHLAIHENFMAVSVPTTLKCIKDFNVEGFALATKAGQVCKMMCFNFYDFNSAGKISRIRVAIHRMSIS